MNQTNIVSFSLTGGAWPTPTPVKTELAFSSAKPTDVTTRPDGTVVLGSLGRSADVGNCAGTTELGAARAPVTWTFGMFHHEAGDEVTVPRLALLADGQVVLAWVSSGEFQVAKLAE